MEFTQWERDYIYVKKYFIVLNKALQEYEALTPVQHETRYDMGHSDTTFLEKLRHYTVGI